MSAYEVRRQEKIKRNQKLMKELDIQHLEVAPKAKKQLPTKKRKREMNVRPSRTSSRIAAGARPSYNEDALASSQATKEKGRSVKEEAGAGDDSSKLPAVDMESLRESWTSWTPTAPPPTRIPTAATFHFESHPDFTPNKSPEEMMREGCFGGSYWRPLYSRSLGTTIAEDWRELPESWVSVLNVELFLTSPTYDEEINKYKVACGQSIEEWEAAGWINHTYDVRGWFQWYCRFFMGRRCDDDERQIGRWKRCVGETGRWRRALLKKYVQLGVRSVFADGDEDEDSPEVSPVVHQTCHHWGFEVRQDVLDEFWRTGK
ncbi:hypothetical protein K402DRAFT_445783 [Aulographum hederae CBS 113979]|uniref:Vegetatible incompatibility protein HET-E-1 n=1 Tax=Aulographum hederae CBS 113979 TaxID=1176131 RepID=A0A6G1H3Q6_9PEZI|nr:hypothetical protein K402DRAFT_445783 [Aulographum hederae CBS 113979]